MSAITLGSLTNSEYDDYLNRKLDQLEKQADAYGTLLASKRMNEQPLCDDPDCEYYEHRHRHRLPRRRGLRSSSSFKENQRRSWNTYYLPEEEEQVQYAGERRQHQQRIRRSSSEVRERERVIFLHVKRQAIVDTQLLIRGRMLVVTFTMNLKKTVHDGTDAVPPRFQRTPRHLPFNTTGVSMLTTANTPRTLTTTMKMTSR